MRCIPQRKISEYPRLASFNIFASIRVVIGSAELFALFASVLIGPCDNVGFAFRKLNRKAVKKRGKRKT